MKPRPVRMPDDLWNALQEEAEERGMGTAEYVRQILRGRTDTQPNTQPNTQSNTLSDTQAIMERLDELEERVADLEASRDAGGDESAERRPQGDGTDEPTQAPPESVDEPQRGEDAHSGFLDDVLAGWEPGRTAEQREQQRAAGRAALEWLRDRDAPVDREELVDALEDEHRPDEVKEDSWWRRWIKPALTEAREVDIVEYNRGHHTYRWIGPGQNQGESQGYPAGEA